MIFAIEQLFHILECRGYYFLIFFLNDRDFTQNFQDFDINVPYYDWNDWDFYQNVRYFD